MFLSYLINVFGIKKVAKNLRILCLIFLKEYIFYIIVNFPGDINILLYSIFTMSLDFLKIRKKQKTEKQKFTIKENVMSEQVKMPVRHFLRRDYLHIFFYLKFLLFVSLVHQISILENNSCKEFLSDL